MRLSAPAGTADWGQARSGGGNEDFLQSDTALKAEVCSVGLPCQDLARSRVNILAGRAGGHQLPNTLSKGRSLKGP